MPEIACEEGRLVAAGAGANLDDGGGVVVPVLGKEHELHLALDAGQLRLDLAALLDRHVDEVAVGLRIVDQRIGLGELGTQRHHFARFLDHGAEFGMIARELDDFLRIRGNAHARLDLVEAVDDLAKAAFAERGHGFLEGE